MKSHEVLVLEARVETLESMLVAMDDLMTRGPDFGRMRAYEAALKLIAGNAGAMASASATNRHLIQIAARALLPVESQLKFNGKQCAASGVAFGTRCALHKGHDGAHTDGVQVWAMKRRGRGAETTINHRAVADAEDAWVAE